MGGGVPHRIHKIIALQQTKHKRSKGVQTMSVTSSQIFSTPDGNHMKNTISMGGGAPHRIHKIIALQQTKHKRFKGVQKMSETSSQMLFQRQNVNIRKIQVLWLGVPP